MRLFVLNGYGPLLSNLKRFRTSSAGLTTAPLLRLFCISISCPINPSSGAWALFFENWLAKQPFLSFMRAFKFTQTPWKGLVRVLLVVLIDLLLIYPDFHFHNYAFSTTRWYVYFLSSLHTLIYTDALTFSLNSPSASRQRMCWLCSTSSIMAGDGDLSGKSPTISDATIAPISSLRVTLCFAFKTGRSNLLHVFYTSKNQIFYTLKQGESSLCNG